LTVSTALIGGKRISPYHREEVSKMLRHLKMKWEELPDGTRRGRYSDPENPDNWIDDPCFRCGDESVPNVCEGDGRYHHHKMVHLPGGSGPEALCRKCAETVVEEWRVFRGALEGTLKLYQTTAPVPNTLISGATDRGTDA
jgi:hypothetical protein